MTDIEQTIANHPFFADMKAEHLAVLVQGAKKATFPAGEILFREGEPANQFYVLLNGRVSLETHEPMDGTYAIEEIGADSVLGWSWLFQPFVWHLQARALEPTTAVVLNGAHLLIAAERNHEFGYELMKRIAQLVVRRLRATRQQLITGKTVSVSANPDATNSP